uniref:Uncharacterized protein n=1 Tax=Panagrolaimus sp. JU765 TaxID=591449 RepID=A0AC34QS70_9BILA
MTPCIVESAEQTEQGSEHSEEQPGVFRRHHGHYFSNADLFSQQNPGFNYLKYAKAEDFEIVNNGSPHVRILDFSFELDPRSNFAKIMLQSNPSYQILHNLNFDLHGGDTLALMYTSEPEIHCFLS